MFNPSDYFCPVPPKLICWVYVRARQQNRKQQIGVRSQFLFLVGSGVSKKRQVCIPGWSLCSVTRICSPGWFFKRTLNRQHGCHLQVAHKALPTATTSGTLSSRKVRNVKHHPIFLISSVLSRQFTGFSSPCKCTNRSDRIKFITIIRVLSGMFSPC